jgi:hypothetical protein
VVPLSIRLPPPPKKGPLPAPVTPRPSRRRRCLPAALQAKAPLLPTNNSLRSDGLAAVEQAPFENFGGSFRNLG